MSSDPSTPLRKIIHVDMDAFFASVEQRDEPAHRGKPLVVGGAPERRGVVAAASYEARKFGIHSAMPSRTAIQKCPHLIFVPPRFEVYQAISNQIREIFFRYTDLVEPLSLDEAYLDVTVNKRGLPSATLLAKEIKAQIQQETRLTASAGISINKFLAKTASGVNKPNGLFLIRPEDAERYVEKLAIEKFYGIGEVTAEKMRKLGVRTGADLKQFTEPELVKRFGKLGSFYFHIVRSRDDRAVEPNRIRRSLGAEESYPEDLVEREAIVAALDEVLQVLKRRVDRNGVSGRTLTLKVKYANYQQVTRSRTQAAPIADLADLKQIALELLETTEVAQRHVRLLGVTLSNFEHEKQPDETTQLTLTFG
jgi:DNA polymerase-4